MSFSDRTVVSLDTDRSKVIIAGICSVILTAGIARFAYTPLLHVMQTEVALSTSLGGWLATFNYIGYMTGVIFISLISDLKLKFHIYRAGLIASVFTTIAMGWTESPMLWALLRFISGISSTSGILLAAGFVLNWLRNRNFRAELGVHYTGVGIGIVLSGLAVTLMANQLSWSYQWELLGILGILFLLPAWFWMPTPESAVKAANKLTSTGPSNKWMWMMIGAYFCAGFGYVISATFIVAILENLPLLTGKGAMVWILLGMAAIPGAFMWDRVSRKTGDLNALLIAFYAHVFSIIIPALIDCSLANLCAAMLFGNTFTGIVSLTLSLIGREFPQNPAKAMARLTLSYSIAQIVGPAVAASISVWSGGYRESLWLASLMIVVGIVLLHILKKIEDQNGR